MPGVRLDGAAGEGGVGDRRHRGLGGDQQQQETGCPAGEGEAGHEDPEVPDLIGKEACQWGTDHICCRDHTVHLEPIISEL